ncbi:helix-turn-helix domain-containing protein [Saccharopolyspora mangrovi]|uniref:GAF domain-containing protein n=1 Tax=Saccharopolyspora mangrovi TaxID=3082379 RepID=A0ABU6AIS2_9PSEU|nr:GAF domain-containing protein [Saccharopolyspora sp. S2-29]MEB3371440.1 GAF domain-containing protein [Saccharopolyspora sp. S2-29]
MRDERFEAALPVGEDPHRYARLLARVHDAAVAGETPPARPRPVIGASWTRMRTRGLDPERGGRGRSLRSDELVERRRASPLSEVLPLLRGRLGGVAEQTANIMVITDADGHVLWRDGSTAVRRNADALGFVEGVSWGEDVVGTNAIGTALVTGQPMQVYSAEHYVRTHHAWTCASAPVRDPRTGGLLGVVDLSGPAATVSPTTLALVQTVAQLAEAQLLTSHFAAIEALRGSAVPILSRVPGPAVVTDPHGWVAASSGIAPVNHIALPVDCGAGRAWLPALGECSVEPVPGGWLVRLLDDDPTATFDERTRVRLDLRNSQARIDVNSASGTWNHPLSPRHAELLFLLAVQPGGCTAGQLAAEVFGDERRTVTVRAEMSRLRRNLGCLLSRRPYRFSENVEVEVLRPNDPGSLLPHSTAPAVRGG